MKVVVNRNNRFFDLSVLAIKRIAELNGVNYYFFKSIYNKESGIYEYEPIVLKNTDSTWSNYVFNVNNPNDYKCEDYGNDEAMEREDSIYINNLWYDRSNPILIQVVEELGEKASTVYSKLEIIEIPDGIEYEIENKDYGYEYIYEKHRIW
jgi:hypothetical protein